MQERREFRLVSRLPTADTDGVSKLIETLAAELERPRELTPRVLNYIGGTYGIDHDAIGAFLVDELPKLEDYELDLILSPAFTPKLADQAVFAELLGRDSVPREQWPALIQQLVNRPTSAQLVTTDSRAHSVPLREVTIERYVHRLRLEATISESLFNLIDRIPPAADRPLLKAVARRTAWESDARSNILNRYLAAAVSRDIYRLADTVDLLDMVESYKPADVADLIARIPARQEELRAQINAGSGGKPFFSNAVQAMHGGGRDQRRQDDVRTSAKENELAFLDRLHQVFTVPAH